MVPVEDLMLRPPEGWTVVLGMAYCPRHKVEVKLTHTNVIEMPAREAGKE